MYKLIGSDNREYGPASEDTVRRWIAEGRANGESQAQKEGEGGWRPLASFPEFAAALATGSVPPPPGPASAPAPQAAASGAGPGAGPGLAGTSPIDTNALANRLCARTSALDVGACLSQGFQVLQVHFWLVVGAWAVSSLVQIALGFVPYVGGALGIFLGAVFLGGMHWFFLRLSRGEPATVGDVFAGFGPCLGPLILVGIVSFLLETVGLLLCLLPGIYLIVAWHYAALLALDKKVDFWSAMELSRRVVTRNWFGVFLLGLVAILLWLAGFALCLVGIFVAGPVASAILVAGYRQLFEEDAAPSA